MSAKADEDLQHRPAGARTTLSPPRDYFLAPRESVWCKDVLCCWPCAQKYCRIYLHLIFNACRTRPLCQHKISAHGNAGEDRREECGDAPIVAEKSGLMPNCSVAMCLPYNADSHGKTKWETHLRDSEYALILKNDGDFYEHETGICRTAVLAK
jgi:hypothetical protein